MDYKTGLEKFVDHLMRIYDHPIANAFTRAYQGKYTRDQLRQKILQLLGK